MPRTGVEWCGIGFNSFGSVAARRVPRRTKGPEIRRAKMRLTLTYILTVLLIVSPAFGEDEQDRLVNCGTVLDEVLSIPDNIPQELLDKAECVIVIPSVKKIALGFGGSYGK